MKRGELIYCIYTVRDLREWLIDNKQNGLSEYAIAPTRAYALINNPCAKDEEPAIVVAFDRTQPIGYSAVFADEYVKGNTIGRLFWGTTEWLEPKYRGKGIAGKMMQMLKETVGIDKYIGLDSSIASIKLDRKQGATIKLYERTRFQLRAKGSLLGMALTLYHAINNRIILRHLAKYNFQNEYVNFVDTETYRFVESHSQHDLFLRQHEMLNWILQYPFLIATRSDVKAKKDICEFGSSVSEHKVDAIKVYVQNQLVGFYIVTQTNNNRALRYLYYDEAYRNEVFASVTLNLIKKSIEKIYFISPELQQFMHQQGIKHLNRKSYIENVALTLPPRMSIDLNLRIQGGDGDMFC